MNPLINILIRTGKRKDLFLRCLKSIQSQTYKNIRIIVSTDGYQIKGVENIEVVPDLRYPYYWNLYCNELKELVNDGWFFFLDDDDVLESSQALEKMLPHLTDESAAVICQFKRWDNKKPSDLQIKNRQIIRGMIGMPCIFLHHSQKSVSYFDGYKAADFRFIKDVAQKIKTKFVSHVIVRTDRISKGKSYENRISY